MTEPEPDPFRDRCTCGERAGTCGQMRLIMPNGFRVCFKCDLMNQVYRPKQV